MMILRHTVKAYTEIDTNDMAVYGLKRETKGVSISFGPKCGYNYNFFFLFVNNGLKPKYTKMEMGS